MTHIFIELYSENQKWAAMPEDSRSQYIENVIVAVGQVAALGIEVLAYGANESGVHNRAPYDFFAIYKVPDPAALAMLQDAIQGSGWYDYFDQINVGGPMFDAFDVLRSHANGKALT
jgi:hypothetical protein